MTIFVADMKESPGSIVAFIEKRRKEYRISQAAMAGKLGISRRQYQRMESGEAKIGLDVLEEISDILGVKLLMVDKLLLGL